MAKRSRRSSINKYFIFGLLITVLLIIIVASIGRSHFNGPQKFGLDVVGKGQYIVTRISGGVNHIWESYIALWDVRGENKFLRAELDKSLLANQEYREAMAANVRLHKLLDFKESIQSPTITTQIIGRDPSLWFHTLTIDRGAGDGIEKGMPVVTVEGVVGQILETSRTSSKVLLAHDQNSAVNALIQKNRVQGIIKGRGAQEYHLQYVLKNADVSQGDIIITSGLGGSFPKGIPIATVTKVTKTRRGMFQKVEAEPTVNFSQLEYLIVILQQNSLVN
ncbi:MAG: rod shape-determining protein MreC [Desulfobulbaceae bacterium]|jgi:rod shape-determining protein MreC|nr:rod shape-determining protein MreC [Desulfobulbaceae bacterium]